MAVLVANLVACDGDAGPSAAAVEPSPVAATTRATTVYLTDAGRLVAIRRTVQAKGDRVLEAVRSLLQGPTDEERGDAIDTAIPSGSKVIDSTVRGTVAVLSFNETFIGEGVDVVATAASRSEYTVRLAQVTFTATAVTGIDRVEIAVPGATWRFTRADFDEALLASGSSSSTVPIVEAASGSPTAREVPGIDAKDAAAVQQRLAELRYLPASAVNGSYDDRTTQAVMAFQAWEGLIPDGVVGDLTAARLLASDPPRPEGAGDGRRIEIYRDKGTVLLVEGGETVRSIHASTGESGDDPPHATPPGGFLVTAKALKDWSEPYEVWMPYACYFNGGIAIHGADAVPPWPASHGCVRVPMVEAPVVYRFVSVGTPVHVY